jgi:hypothetical protein
MSTKSTTKKSSKPVAAKKPVVEKSPAKETKRTTAKEKGTATTTTTDGNLTVIEIPPATVETIGNTIEKPPRTRKSKVPKEPAAATNAKALSQLDAAVKVLGEATEPLTTKQMVEAMTAKGYWSSPGGKTPHATLYSSILRELQTKADTSRFVKTDRGHF